MGLINGGCQSVINVSKCVSLASHHGDGYGILLNCINGL